MPTVETLFLLVLSILALESADSIRSLYRHFLSGITRKSLNAFYYACSYAKADYSNFMNATASIALKLIPEKLQSQPVFLCIDDTVVSKFGKTFEDIFTIFDHAAHNGSNYLNSLFPLWMNMKTLTLLAMPELTLLFMTWLLNHPGKRAGQRCMEESCPSGMISYCRMKKSVTILCLHAGYSQMYLAKGRLWHT